ncbi:methyltransferase [Amycolatopsis sp. NPDC049688]|uniref:methyltransferase n=1 Tax=Amycolatopsis sp. NPDC049688 TaxID=3154733 RepID=UPI00344019FE
MNTNRLDVGNALTTRHGAEAARSSEFELLGRAWTLLPGVFAPTLTMSTALFTEWLPYPVNGSFLEVGTGAGVTAVSAALRGCASVTAADISAAAADNARVNAERHGVSDRVRVLRTDLFDAIEPGTRYDVIFWNSNVINAPDEFAYTDDLQWAFFDRHYDTHRRYLAQAGRFLNPGGRLFLGFNSLGDWVTLTELAREAGFEVRTERTTQGQVGDFPVEISLLEFG